MRKIWLSLILLALLSSACLASRTTTPDQSAEETQASIAETGAPTDTATPEPATETPTPEPPTPTATATVPPVMVAVGPEDFPENVNPLTGLQVSEPKNLERRPIGIKINIVPRVQYLPTWGLSLADIVYDYYHNDGYSRFHAIFYSNDTEFAGAIRSGRLLDNALVRMYKSIFVYGGADERIDQVFWSSDYSDRLVREGPEQLCPPTSEAPLCRYEPSGVAHLLADTLKVHDYIQGKGVSDSRQNLDGMTFDPQAPEGGQPVLNVITRYSSDMYSRWEYDPESGRYLRFQDAAQDTGAGESFAPLMDRVTEQQIATDNVVVLFASHEDILADTKGEIIDINLSGSGKAYAFRDGQAYELQWNRPQADSVLYLTFADGSRYPYKNGTTWYQVVGVYSKLTEEDADTWRFQLGIP
jgi:hypothetical protein